MWIRSQNKQKLSNCNNFVIMFSRDDDKYEILNSDREDRFRGLLGGYKTRERAFEVLDEIQQYIVGKIVIPTYRFEPYENMSASEVIKSMEIEETIERLPMVYEMPKE